MGKSWHEIHKIWGLPQKVEKEVEMEREDWIPKSQAERDRSAQGIVSLMNDAEKHIKHSETLREVRIVLTGMVSAIDSDDYDPREELRARKMEDMKPQ